MKFRTKIYLSLIFLSFACLSIGISIAYFHVKKLFFYEMQSKAITIAATTASFLDAEVIKHINTPKDASSEEYISFREKLRKARNNNQRQDVFVIYMYTLKPSIEDPKKMVVAISAANTPEETQPIGTPYTSSYAKKLGEHLYENFSPNEFIKDRWGIWLTAFAPIYDAQGNYTATLGIDISAEDIEYQLLSLLKITLFSLLIAFCISILSALFLGKTATHSLTVMREAIEKISKGDFSLRPHLETHDEFHDLAEEISVMADGLHEREKLKINFAKYVSSHVLEKTLALEAPGKIEGERKKITVIFSGIRNFLQLTETLPPEEIVIILNQYFAQMIEIVFHYQGTLDKFVSGGMMIEFGAPKDDPKQEQHAVEAAIEMKKVVKTLSEKWRLEGKPHIEIGIGVHTGLAVVGNIGSEKRMEYTAIGDTVNVASRLQALSQDIGQTLVISETTYQAVKDSFSFTNLGMHEIVGRKEGITLYTL